MSAISSAVSAAPFAFPPDYAERVYAGILGKIIGVYLGRPFEGWTHERIMAELGPITGYVHERFDVPLVVTDDDIAGTFAFLRALPDNGYTPDLTPGQIGEAWRNYLIYGRTVLWWGGLGTSTEHTAFLRLMDGVQAPESGSMARNGQTIAEQIGAQIFIDGWAMLFPGDPERAVDWARRAGSVSHDGAAIHGAQVIAALEALAFTERDMNVLLDEALRLIPADSVIARLIADVREWHARDDDWLATRALIQRHYNYELFPGACHMVPNHALIIHALLHGNGDFGRTQMVVNTDGWDTDCNAGNVGCILGIRDGLAAFDGPVDWRGPVTDRLYSSTADGSRAISDAVIETDHVVSIARALHGATPEPPRGRDRFHFSYPGAVQGFRSDDPATLSVDNRQTTTGRALGLTLTGMAGTATTPTFIPEEAQGMKGYRLYASPTLHAGQRVTGDLQAARGPVTVTPVIRVYRTATEIETIDGPAIALAAGSNGAIDWRIPDTGGCPVMAIGLRVSGDPGDGVLLDRLGWDGAPTVTLGRVPGTDIWRDAWVNGVDTWESHWAPAYQIAHNRGVGLISQGTADWRDVTVTATVGIPLARSAGIAARVGGMRRYVALLLADDGMARIVQAVGERTVLAEAPFPWQADEPYELELTVSGDTARARINGSEVLATTGIDPGLTGGVGFILEEGTMRSNAIAVRPASA
ncbi:MAG TPA: ADP-ribosylglycohydrolase family protein [Thermomicrobiales bacterium]|jgi:ADP-ribosylglycohydrolase|nr:ADP-ribosylglycohydrolase family protein [Thermomicrobiales bacterium]